MRRTTAGLSSLLLALLLGPLPPLQANILRAAPAPHAPSAHHAVPARDTMRSGYGTVTFDGLVQIWYISDFPGFFHTFRVRRTELKLSGSIRPKFRWTVMVDPAKLLNLSTTFENVTPEDPPVVSVGVNQASRILQDAYLTLDFAPQIKVDLGQRKVPLSLEGLQSSASLKTVERALFLSDRARGGDLDDVRDIGILAYGTVNSRFDYFLGVSNGIGESQNTVDENSGKALAGRLVVRPTFLNGLQLGASGAWNAGQIAAPFLRSRAGGDLLFEHGPFTLQSEVMGGEDAGIHRLGSYVLAAYKFTPLIEPVLQFDWFDPDRARDDTAVTVAERDYLVGLNLYIDGDHLKFQANYIRKTFGGVIRPFNSWLFNGQMAW